MSLLAKFKLSGLSIALIVIAFIAFIFAKIYIPTPEEYEQQFAKVVHENLQKDIAKSFGITVEELENKEKRGKELFLLYTNLYKAINENNKIQLLNTLSDLSLKELKKKSPGLLSSAIKAKNITALKLLIGKGISCDSTEVSGKNAFSTAINAEDSKYIRYLERSCNYSEKKSIAQRISTSFFPEKIFDLGNNEKTQKIKDEMFITQVRLGHEKAAFRLLKNGMSPNAQKDGYSVLLITIMAGKPKLAKELIKQGADIMAKTPGNMSILTAALLRNQKDIAQYILREAPNYFSTIEEERVVLRLILALNETPSIDTQALNFLLNHGMDSSRFVNEEGHLWLRKAVRLRNIKLIKKLLELGVDKNNQDNLNNLLKSLKTKNKYINQSIADLLIQHGAIEVIRKPKIKRAFTTPKNYSKKGLLLINTLWKNKRRYYQNIATGDIIPPFELDGVKPKQMAIIYDFQKDNALVLKSESDQHKTQWSLSSSKAQLYIKDSTYEIVTLNEGLLKIRYKITIYGIGLYDTYEFEAVKPEN